MSIYAYTGTPGSGKTMDAARQIIFHLKHGKPVIANFHVSEDTTNYDLFKYIDNDDLSADLLAEYAREWFAQEGRRFRESEILLVLDEVQLCFNGRTWSKNQKVRLSFISFLSQHRKMGYKVILITQSLKMIDNQFRMLVEWECYHRNVSKWGMLGWILSLPFAHRLIHVIQYMAQDRQRVGSEYFVVWPSQTKLVDSFATFVPNFDT